MPDSIKKSLSDINNADKKAQKALSNIVRKGVKDLPKLLDALENLKQTHMEFEIGAWTIIIDNP